MVWASLLTGAKLAKAQIDPGKRQRDPGRKERFFFPNSKNSDVSLCS